MNKESSKCEIIVCVLSVILVGLIVAERVTHWLTRPPPEGYTIQTNGERWRWKKGDYYTCYIHGLR